LAAIRQRIRQLPVVRAVAAWRRWLSVCTPDCRDEKPITDCRKRRESGDHWRNGSDIACG
jgi:hypothetical protein